MQKKYCFLFIPKKENSNIKVPNSYVLPSEIGWRFSEKKLLEKDFGDEW